MLSGISPEAENASVLLSAKAYSTLDRDDVVAAFCRFAREDWGDVSKDERIANDEAVLAESGEAVGSYRDRNGAEFCLQMSFHPMLDGTLRVHMPERP